MDNKKKIIVSSILVVALVALVVGTTFALVNLLVDGTSNLNTIDLGQISMSYTEPSNSYELIDALPMSDAEGGGQTKFFEFTVASHATTNESDNDGVVIPYEVNISNIAIDSDKTLLPSDKVKINLVKVVNNVETEVVAPVLLKDLEKSQLNSEALLLYKTSDVHKNNSDEIVTQYRLRAWIDKGFVIDNNSDVVYQYKFRVNVNSHVNASGVPYEDKIILFQNGDNTRVTGGWTSKVKNNNFARLSTFVDTTIGFNRGNGGNSFANGFLITNNTIDLTDYDTITVDLISDVTLNLPDTNVSKWGIHEWGIGLLSTVPDTFTGSDGTYNFDHKFTESQTLYRWTTSSVFAARTSTFDISEVKGSYHIVYYIITYDCTAANLFETSSIVIQ